MDKDVRGLFLDRAEENLQGYNERLYSYVEPDTVAIRDAINGIVGELQNLIAVIRDLNDA